VVVNTPATTSSAESRAPAESGARSGALLATSALVATGLNYVFLLTAGRILGDDDYGDLAALLALLTVVLLPTGAVQLAVSREISRRIALGDEEGAAAFSWATLRLGLLATVPLVAALLLLTFPLRELLNIESTGAVALAVSGLLVALAFPIAMGALQGFQRFHAVAAMYVTPFALRVALLAVVAWAGYRLGGAVLAAAGGGIASTVVAIALLRAPLRRGAQATRPTLRPFLRYLGPVVVGLMGIAVLTNVDLLVVQARFPDDAGAYAAASALARVAFFLPATILAVLFPRTAARQARGEDTADILGRTFLVTAAFGGFLSLFYAMTGRGLVVTSFGEDFARGGDWIVPLAISMTLFALVNVLVGFHLSRGETRFAWIVAASVPVQLVALVVVPNGARAVIWTDIVIATGLLCAHEVIVDSSVPALRAGLRHLVHEIGLARRTLTEALLVLVGFSAFVCVLFWPLVANLGSLVIGRGSDSSGTVYSLWQWNEEGGYHLFGQTHHTLTGAPFGWEGDNGLNIQWLVPYYPAYLATKVFGEVAAHNLILLAGYVLSGASMYLLVRYLGCKRLVAAWGGMVFVVFPWHLERTPHASLVHLEFLPLLLLALVASARRPSALRILLVAGAVLACWLTSGYFGAMAVIASVLFALVTVLFGSGRDRARFVVGVTSGVVGATLLVAFLSAVSGVGRGSGLQRITEDLRGYGIRPLGLVLPAADNLVLGGTLDGFWGTRQHGSNLTETSNYLGLLTIALALGWLALAWRRGLPVGHPIRIATVGFATVAVAALLLGLPSPIKIFGSEIPMPSRFLWEVVPPFRVPSRWIVTVVAALVPLAALALQAGLERFGRTRRQWRSIPIAPAALVASAMLVSFFELAVDPAQSRVRMDEVPQEYTALARTPQGIVAEYPLVQDIDHLVWQRVHGRPVLNSEAFGTPADEARRVVLDPAAPETPARLAFLGVTAIVTHPDALAYTGEPADVPNAEWGPGYRLVARTRDGTSVWRVTASTTPALVTLPSGFGEALPPEGGDVPFPLTSPAGVGYFELRAKAPALLRLTFTAYPPAGEARELRLSDGQTEVPFPLGGRQAVSVLVDVPAGLSRLLVKTDPAATSLEDAIVLTAPRAELATGTPQLRAEAVSPDIGF
jgi:O-antigen/teichoic acid export membrane protein